MCEGRELRVLTSEDPVTRLEFDSTLQILARGIAISGEAAGERHCIQNVIRIRVHGKRTSEVKFRLLDVTRVEAFHSVVEVIFGAVELHGLLAQLSFTDLQVRPRFISDVDRGSLCNLAERLAGLAKLLEREQPYALLKGRHLECSW